MPTGKDNSTDHRGTGGPLVTADQSIQAGDGVRTFRTQKGEEIMSVSDQYLYRGGISHAVPGVKRLFASIGGRIEGVPVRDAFGQSNGFRRPGYAIDVIPGSCMWLGSETFFPATFRLPWSATAEQASLI
jgi:hypothetical protein